MKKLIIEKLENIKNVSAWNKAINDYCFELLENVENEDDFCNKNMLEKAMLNGADNWTQYSYGGCSLCYNYDIAKRLCTPSAFKKSKQGPYNPNNQENWLDCQARALYQASKRILWIQSRILKTKEVK
jgi:hypothetical protein